MPPFVGAGAGATRVRSGDTRRVTAPTVAIISCLVAGNRDARSRGATAGAALFALYSPHGRTARPQRVCVTCRKFLHSAPKNKCHRHSIYLCPECFRPDEIDRFIFEQGCTT